VLVEVVDVDVVDGAVTVKVAGPYTELAPTALGAVSGRLLVPAAVVVVVPLASPSQVT
jgi:hypothetical protein